MNYESMIIKAKQIYNDDQTGHDFSHIQRVIDFCKIIHEKEGGNWDVIFISALFHDIHRILSNEENRYITPEESIDYVKVVLSEFDIEEHLLNNILYIIENHDNKTGDTSVMLELQIVQDADLLDSIGQIGLDRTIKYCRNKNIPVYDSNYSLNTEKYIPDFNPISATHYVYRTMMPKTSLLNTKTAKNMANPQVDVLKKFIDENVCNKR